MEGKMKWVTSTCVGHVLQVDIRRSLHTRRCQGQLEQEAFIAMQQRKADWFTDRT